MKKNICTFILFVCIANVSAQLKVNSLGEITNTNAALTFKVNSVVAGFSGNNAQGNVSFGYGSLLNQSAGTYNTAVGSSALYTNAATGNYNTAIGYQAGNNNANNLTNTTSIGCGATATASNQVKIGNSSAGSIGDYAGWTTFLSDKRAKKNIRADVPGLDFINRLQPVTYNRDLDAIDSLLKINRKDKLGISKVVETGFLAQDVEESAKSIGYDFNGVDIDGTGLYGLRYETFVVPVVKAVQELSEQNDRLQAQINELTGQVSALLRSGSAAESATGMQEVAVSGVALHQNAPNPFSQSTVIRYTLPPTGKQAQMVISNTAGNIVRQIPLQAGTDSITIEGSALSAGVYYYSLYVGNSLVDTKKMILTK